MLSKSDESRHPCLVPYLQGNRFSFSLLSVMSAVGLSSYIFGFLFLTFLKSCKKKNYDKDYMWPTKAKLLLCGPVSMKFANPCSGVLILEDGLIGSTILGVHFLPLEVFFFLMLVY